MRLSDAIALGRTLANGITADLYIHSDTNCACAIGMAQLAGGLTSHDESWVVASWPWLLQDRIYTCPSCSSSTQEGGISAISHVMGHVIGTVRVSGTCDGFSHLEKDLTLDQLIDWVRSIEPPEVHTETEQAVAESEARAEVGETLC
jgi:hypothetical protein